MADPESSAEKLLPFLKKISENLRNEGVPVDENCRIEMHDFFDLHGKETIETDIKKVRNFEKSKYSNIPEKRIEEEKQKTNGEKLEMLIVVLFSKFLKDKFIVARSSRYDDIENGVDTIILERETGKLVCALDEVADTEGKQYHDKVEKITKKNKKGSKLKYGLKMENGKLSKGAVEGAPIFYIALSERHLNEGIKNLSLSLEEKSDYEKNLFRYFTSSLQSQYDSLVLEKHVDQLIKSRVETFKEVLDKFKESR
ncbi:MAG: hypothetical protein WC587_01360 [Candidatus Paceibacterota bacterium]